MQVMIVLEHFPKEDLRKFLVQMGRRYALYVICGLLCPQCLIARHHEKHGVWGTKV